IEQLDRRAAEMQRHRVLEADHGVGRIDVLERVDALGKALAPRLDLIGLPARPSLRNAVMHDHVGGRRKQAGAADMVGVALGDEYVTHTLCSSPPQYTPR